MPTPKVTLNLTLKDRIGAFTIVATLNNASLADWDYIEELKNLFSLDDAAYKEFSIERLPDGNLSWQKAKAEAEKKGETAKSEQEMPYEVSTGAYELLKREIQTRDGKKQIGAEQVSIARKILES